MRNEFGQPNKPLPRWTVFLFVACLVVLLVFFVALFVINVKLGSHRWDW